MNTNPLTVFISSTCRDLLDLRDELRTHLQANGFAVRAPECVDSDFEITDGDTLATCLHNVRNSGLVICVVDGRYGSIVKTGEYAGKSATQAEIEFARSLQIPCRFFIRDRAFLEFQTMKPTAGNKKRKQAYVTEHRNEWQGLVKAIVDINGANNWVETFKTVVDLKPTVTRRITKDFRNNRSYWR